MSYLTSTIVVVVVLIENYLGLNPSGTREGLGKNTRYTGGGWFPEVSVQEPEWRTLTRSLTKRSPGPW